MNQSYQDELTRHKGHDLADIIVDYLYDCSYDEAAKVSDIMLNGRIYPFDLNSAIRILDKIANLVMPKYFWSPVPVIMGLKPTEINDLTQDAIVQAKKLPRVRPNIEKCKEWTSVCPNTQISKLPHWIRYPYQIRGRRSYILTRK